MADPKLLRVRASLATIFLFGAVGTAAELLLLEHTEGYRQWAPLALLGVGVVVLAWASVSRRPLATRIFQGLMLLTVASAVAGLWLHFDANIEFEQEIYPDLSGWALVWKSLHGTAPPALAPGAMALLGLIGLVWGYVDQGTKP